jgi:hypothetical protein
MEIVSYNKKELQAFIDSDFFNELDKVPISRHRAISHIRNPYCPDDYVLLWAAYEGNSLAGYAGVLPDCIELNGAKHKICWFSCFWVHESYRKQNVAPALFYSLMKTYENQLFVSNMLFSLEKSYQKSQIFQPTQSTKGYTFYRTFCFGNILKARFPWFKHFLPIYLFTEKILNFILGIRCLTGRKIKTKIEVVENGELNDELRFFLDNFSKSNENSIVRDLEHFKWIIENPWVQVGKPDKESQRYYFSSKAEQFEYRLLKVYISEKLSGFIILKIRDKKLVVSYLYLPDQYKKDVASYILNFINDEKIQTLTCFDKVLSTYFSKKQSRFVFIKNTKQLYLFPKDMEISSSILQAGDGDSVFT